MATAADGTSTRPGSSILLIVDHAECALRLRNPVERGEPALQRCESSRMPFLNRTLAWPRQRTRKCVMMGGTDRCSWDGLTDPLRGCSPCRLVRIAGFTTRRRQWQERRGVPCQWRW
jgi:hypothetical protein